MRYDVPQRASCGFVDMRFTVYVLVFGLAKFNENTIDL